MGMVWFMIPASLVICTVLLNQTERSNKGILKMLSLPVSTTKLCLAKFIVLLILAAVQMILSIGAYYICAAIVTHTQDYNFILELLYVCKIVCSLYAAAIAMAAVYWVISTLISSPIFSVGIGLASICTFCTYDQHKDLVCLSDELPVLFVDGGVWESCCGRLRNTNCLAAVAARCSGDHDFGACRILCSIRCI